MSITSTPMPGTIAMPSPKKYALTFLSEHPLAPLEARVLQRRWRVESGLSDLPVYGVTTLADGGSCRPCALQIGDRQVPLSESTTTSGLLIVQGPPILVGSAGDEVCLSLEVRNQEHRQSDFRGTVLLGDWRELTADLGAFYCQGGGPCQVPTSGGACPGCNYPRAFAHPSSLLDAFLVDQIYVRGTAVQVYPDPGVAPGFVQVVQRDGHLIEYPIPQVPGDPERPTPSPEIVERHLLHASPRQLRAGLDSPAEALNPRAQARLLEYGAALMRVCSDGLTEEDSPRDLALALVDGVVALSRGYHGHLDYRSFRVLERLTRVRGVSYPVMSEVQTILSEIGHRSRAARVRSVTAGNWVVAEDRRCITRPWASYGTTRPFLETVSRIRVALLPGEADHVRIYDLRITEPDNDDGYSVLDRIPGYGPGLVREGPPAQVGEAFMSRYLPGTVLAGHLCDGVSLDYPYSLSPSDLSGGVLIDLGRSLPPLSQVCLVYQVEPGHLFCAAVEPA